MSKQKESHLKKLQQQALQANQKFKNYKNKIVESGCWHPESFVVDSSRTYDNGYGKFTTYDCKCCTICQKLL
jgi:hypothetical protein